MNWPIYSVHHDNLLNKYHKETLQQNETKLFHFHRIFKNGWQGGGFAPPLDLPLILSKIIFSVSNIFMQMFNVSPWCIKSIPMLLKNYVYQSQSVSKLCPQSQLGSVDSRKSLIMDPGYKWSINIMKIPIPIKKCCLI